MKTKAVRLYGKKDLRLEEFELPEIKEDEILAKVISDGICMSSYKAVIQGNSHKRVPDNVNKNPIIIGHEFCGKIIQVGDKWQDRFYPGKSFVIQPSLNSKAAMAAPGYSYPYIGGAATYIIIPNEIIELDCLLEYKGDGFFNGSLAEPLSCIIGAQKASYHTVPGRYVHDMGIKKRGNMSILAGAGPMGLGTIDYTINGSNRPNLLVVTDIDQDRLDHAAGIYTIEQAAKNGVKLKYVNTGNLSEPEKYLLSLTSGKGYDDVFVYAPLRSLVEMADHILCRDGCINFFAGPVDKEFTAGLNFYNIHYNSAHVVGTSGGNTNDMLESLEMIEKRLINPASMITHIGGLNSVVETTLNLPEIPGGKKLIYTNIKLDLTAIADFKDKGKKDPLFARLGEIVEKNNELWSLEGEKILLEESEPI